MSLNGEREQSIEKECFETRPLECEKSSEGEERIAFAFFLFFFFFFSRLLLLLLFLFSSSRFFPVSRYLSSFISVGVLLRSFYRTRLVRKANNWGSRTRGSKRGS